VARLYRDGGADRWSVPVEQFAAALQASVDHAAPADVERYLGGLHLQDLALACACASGGDRAWDHFMRDYRPALYRSADALDPSGGARELADSLYADLYGIASRDGERRSLFRYFHGRSALGTWLRAVLAQRYIDGVRASRRFEPLPEPNEGSRASRGAVPVQNEQVPDPDRARYIAGIQHALEAALARASDRERLRLACYYSQGLTLAETGRITGEHEATVSRQLAKTRKTLRHEVERHLREVDGFDADQIVQCFSSVVDDPGPLDLAGLLRKNTTPDRSI
jgi:RNA polymerase sigma-70 factor (ECF subfamily)